MSSKCRAAGPTGLHGVGAQGAQRKQLLDAARTGVRTGLGVELRPLVAHLAHVAQHQQARAQAVSASTSMAARTESGLAL